MRPNPINIHPVACAKDTAACSRSVGSTDSKAVYIALHLPPNCRRCYFVRVQGCVLPLRLELASPLDSVSKCQKPEPASPHEP
jgi:hypothetical protein